MSNLRVEDFYRFWYEDSEPAPITAMHTCSFPDTGLRKSWCKSCGKEGEFNTITGRYEVKDDTK